MKNCLNTYVKFKDRSDIESIIEKNAKLEDGNQNKLNLNLV